MDARARQVLSTALELPEADRADLAAELIASLDREADQDADLAWDEEIRRRVAELDSGQCVPVPWSEVRRLLSGPPDEAAPR